MLDDPTFALPPRYRRLVKSAQRGELALVSLAPLAAPIRGLADHLDTLDCGSAVVIGDDAGWSYGPTGYQPAEITHVIGAADAVFVVSGEPDAAIYRATTRRAQKGQRVVLIEFASGLADSWTTLVHDISGRPPLALSL